MDEKDLIKTLTGLEDSLVKLQETAQQKQEALISNNIRLLEAAVTAEEKFIKSVEIAEKQRIYVLNDLMKKYNLSLNSYKLADFVTSSKNKLDEKNAAQILKIRNRIQKHISQIQQLNHQNQNLIDAARDFIKMTISELVGPQRKSFLDKRA